MTNELTWKEIIQHKFEFKYSYLYYFLMGGLWIYLKTLFNNFLLYLIFGFIYIYLCFMLHKIFSYIIREARQKAFGKYHKTQDIEVKKIYK